MDKWDQLVKILIDKDVSWLIEPRVRFKDTSGEQGTFFITDPSGNNLEFKTFKNDENIFKSIN